MNKLNAQIKKLRKLQKRVDKQRKLIERIAAYGSEELPKKARKQMRMVGATATAVKRVPLSRRLLKKLGLVAVGTCLLAVCGTFAVRMVKNKKQNMDETTRYDVPYGEKDAQENAHFDLDQASLEELENALLKVENEIDQVNAAIEKKNE